MLAKTKTWLEINVTSNHAVTEVEKLFVRSGKHT